MPALTVRAITKALSDYVRPDEDILAKMNLVMPRLYNLGNWQDLVEEWDIETTNDYVALPEWSDTLLAGMISDAPSHVSGRWQDYKVTGYSSNGPAPIYGMIDDGWHPIKEDIEIEANSDLFTLNIDPVTPDTVLPSEGQINIVGWRETTGDATRDSKTEEIITLDGTASITSAYADWHTITQITFEDVHAYVDVIAVRSGVDLATLARVRGDGASRYRRYRFTNPANATTGVRTLLKRGWEPVLTEDDIVYLGNLNVIKHGLLGMLAEDNADLERASYHWNVCKMLLEDEIHSVRGPAKPRPNIDPTGMGASISNIL